jgi:hypothetical protein
MTSSQKPGATCLIVPASGIPLFIREIEEHSYSLADGSFALEYTITSQQYRDSAGRVRRDSDTRDRANSSSGPVASIIDPVAGFHTLILSAEKLAYRHEIKVSLDAPLVYADAADGQDSPHTWKVTHNEIANKMIEGHEFTGLRIVTSAEDAPELTTWIDQWYSNELRLIGEMHRKGPLKAYSIRLIELYFGEPEESLFHVPPGYSVLAMPSQD